MDYVNVQQQSDITFITMNRPTVHNAFDDQMIRELTDAFETAAHNNACRVVVLQAEGRNFSAGADLNWMKSMASLSREENEADALRLAGLMHRVYTLPKMVIAKVVGASFGGALGLISACDVAFADTGATFCLSEVKIGLVPAVISPYVIEAMGIRNARRFMLSAEVFDADMAVSVGLIQAAFPRDQLDCEVIALANVAAKNGPDATAHCKQLINAIAHERIGDKTITQTAKLIADIRVSEEGQEGLTSFLEKRPPAWRVKGEAN
ncbi:enoyl-CoA hydratase-related protein [Ketobacter alkanivorans]|uniref:Enoyl-CoA hydratase n=1 Tax=Ketobacter alkanivorans TaxID=1917421 RepID=A0A2K9LG20_9GAMM|nr:enoyl-CoA hydratase-related protein [Ketobacter alkanivorans]AUM11316.1 hypothetical protein Kalk_02230 [Ketobacter alkanivorans]